MNTPDEYEGPLLTSAQREWLIDPEGSNVEQGSSHERAMSSRIRRRIRNAVIDFQIVSEHLPKKDRRTLFTPDENDKEGVGLFIKGLSDMLRFVYEGCYYADPDIYMDFEKLIQNAVEEAERDRRDGVVNVVAELNVTVEEKYDLDEALEKFADGDNLTFEEIGALLATETVEEPENVAALVKHAREKGVTNLTIPTLARENLNQFRKEEDSGE